MKRWIPWVLVAIGLLTIVVGIMWREPNKTLRGAVIGIGLSALLAGAALARQAKIDEQYDWEE